MFFEKKLQNACTCQKLSVILLSQNRKEGFCKKIHQIDVKFSPKNGNRI